MRRAMLFVLMVLAVRVRAVPTKIDIKKVDGAITVDGDVSDSAWQGAKRIDGFVEYFRSDNTQPPAKTIGLLAYDQDAVYVAFVAEDPRPGDIRAPLVDRDKVLGDQDYVSILIDTLNDRRSGVAFRVNARGVQTDSVVNDATGEEDFSPDFFYQAVAIRTPTGWSAEMRIPLSSLRYPATNPQDWGVIMMRNYPRDFRYIMSNTPIPKNSNCFLCHAATLTGLENLPTGSHFTLTPYTTASASNQPQVRRSAFENDQGLDLKWNPSTRLTIDATLNPDFSQIEADVPQLSVNNRFALSYPEKRTFFLESVDLLATPLQAVYTRTITSPAWGIRATGQSGTNAYTLFVAEDRGGGVTIIPSMYGSTMVPQDQRSRVAIGRLRRSFGDSFIGLLASARDVEGGGHNRLIGPDYQWKPTKNDRFFGQVLVSDTDGEGGFASRNVYTRDSNRWDVYSGVRMVSPKFRADNGFIPQSGLQQTYQEGALRFRPKNALTYVRTYFGVAYAREFESHDLMWLQFHPGFYFQGKWGSEGWMTLRVKDRERVNGNLLDYSFVEFSLQAAPKRWLPAIKLEGAFGEKVDYTQGRLGDGANLSLSATIRPTDHFELQGTTSHEWLDLDAGRLFTAQIDWLKATYTFSARSLVRLVGQQSQVERAGARTDRSLSLSGLYGYRVNFQTVFFVGYGDSSITDGAGKLFCDRRSVFMKVAYAFQR